MYEAADLARLVFGVQHAVPLGQRGLRIFAVAQALAVADRRRRRGFRDRARAESAVARKRAVHGRRRWEHRDVHAGELAPAVADALDEELRRRTADLERRG